MNASTTFLLLSRHLFVNAQQRRARPSASAIFSAFRFRRHGLLTANRLTTKSGDGSLAMTLSMMSSFRSPHSLATCACHCSLSRLVFCCLVIQLVGTIPAVFAPPLGKHVKAETAKSRPESAISSPNFLRGASWVRRMGPGEPCWSLSCLASPVKRRVDADGS